MQPRPTDIKLHRKSRSLELHFDDGEQFSLSCEYLRVHSPSAEVSGHGVDVLQIGKEGVNIKAIEPIGNYAVRLIFDDGHDTGLFSWAVLYDLGKNHDQKWQHYLDRLAEAGYSRKSEIRKNQ